MLQGIAGAFGVRVPVSYLISRTANATLFHIGLATPLSSIVQLFLCLLIPENDDGMYLKILREAACLFGNKPLRNALLHAESEVKICELIHNWTPPADLHYEPDFSEDDEDA